MAMKGLLINTLLCCAALSAFVHADEVGSVDTKFNLLSPDDSVKIEVFDDPSIEGVACYLSRAEKGGYKGAVGIAEDTSDASLECVQVGPIRIIEELEEEEQVFNERRSLIFKRMRVVRFCDTPRNTIVYLVYSERVIEGSPKNSVSAVPISRWAGTDPGEALPICRY
jgi:CreA protein